jgi:hypothetical protein
MSDESLDKLYAQTKDELPPESLDALVLTEAQANQPQPSKMADRSAKWYRNKAGLGALASAAVLLLTVGVFLNQPAVEPQLAATATPSLEAKEILQYEILDVPAGVGQSSAELFADRTATPEPDSMKPVPQMRLKSARAPAAESEDRAALNVPPCAEVAAGICRKEGKLYFEAQGCREGFKMPLQHSSLDIAAADSGRIAYSLGNQRMQVLCLDGRWQVRPSTSSD